MLHSVSNTHVSPASSQLSVSHCYLRQRDPRRHSPSSAACKNLSLPIETLQSRCDPGFARRLNESGGRVGKRRYHRSPP
jgi:hypothetical protein